MEFEAAEPIRLAGQPVFHSIDKDLTNAIQSMVETDQEFFDTYLAAHAEKHGERFTVR